MPSSSCITFLFDFTQQICMRSELITPSSAKGRMSHRGISVRVGCMKRLMQRSPRAVFSPRGDVITRDFLNTRFIHRALLPTRGPSTKQAVSIATTASGHVSPLFCCYLLFQEGMESETVCVLYMDTCACVNRTSFYLVKL